MSAAIIKPAATLSLDLDNLWLYLRAHGDEAWREYPSYLNLAVPRILELLESLELEITLFLVGRDITQAKHAAVFQTIADSPHEIANHSFDHLIDFHRAPAPLVLEEITQTEDAIASLGKPRPVGFRGPSFRLSQTILDILVDRGYRYDASTFPTFAGPLARAYHFATSRLDAEQKAQAGDLFGSFKDGLRSLHAYQWALEPQPLVEIPVTTFPILRMPVHLTYVNFLADFSPALARGYFSAAMNACRSLNVAPSLLLHATDVIGVDDAQCPRFLPGMKRSHQAKTEDLRRLLQRYCAKFEVMTLSRYVDHKLAQAPTTNLPTRRL